MANLKTPLLMFIISGAIAYGFYFLYHGQNKQYDYPKTKARIDSVYFSTFRDSDNDHYITEAYFTYSFSIDGQSYTGESIGVDARGEEVSIRVKPSSYFDQYTKDKLMKQNTVSVQYNPEDPTDSFTIPIVNGGFLVGASFAGFLSLLGLLGVFTALFSKRGVNN